MRCDTMKHGDPELKLLIAGPVAALYRFKTEEEVIARANDTNVGLAG